MAANPVVFPDDLDSICMQSLASIPEIQYLYVKEELNSASVLVVVQDKSFGIERAIYDMQPEIIDARPGIKFNLRVISLRGRKLSDVMTPRGQLLLKRDTIANESRAS